MSRTTQRTHHDSRKANPHTCRVCEAPLDKHGRCTQLQRAEYVLSRRSEPCGCYVCTVAGGDCARVGLIEQAPAFIREHKEARCA